VVETRSRSRKEKREWRNAKKDFEGEILRRGTGQKLEDPREVLLANISKRLHYFALTVSAKKREAGGE